jgi:hypothetical protein
MFVSHLVSLGLGTEYFRILLQSNCGVSVLDFTPQVQGRTANICLNRLNQVLNLSSLYYIYFSVCLLVHLIHRSIVEIVSA